MTVAELIAKLQTLPPETRVTYEDDTMLRDVSSVTYVPDQEEVLLS